MTAFWLRLLPDGYGANGGNQRHGLVDCNLVAIGTDDNAGRAAVQLRQASLSLLCALWRKLLSLEGDQNQDQPLLGFERRHSFAEV